MQKNYSFELNVPDDKLISLALEEDLSSICSDITTSTLFGENKKIGKARIISKSDQPITICGINVVRHILEKFNTPFDLQTAFQDSDELPAKATLMNLSSVFSTLLSAERTILNFLCHLCAIATLTKKFTDLIKHTNTKILDTRKTTPGFRHLEKYAVFCGGGTNHRMGLYDAILVKDTHIGMLGGIKEAIDKLPLLIGKNSTPVVIEVRNVSELTVVLEKGKQKISRILLDNMSPDLLRQCVEMCDGIFKTEASGNITLDNVVEVAQTGVNYASIGMLTYSAAHANLSMIAN